MSKLTRYSLALFFILPIISILVKLMLSVEIAYIFFDICYLMLQLFVVVLLWLFYYFKDIKNKFGFMLFVISFISFLWCFDTITTGNILISVVNDIATVDILSNNKIELLLLYYLLLFISIIQFVVYIVFLIKTKYKFVPINVGRLSPRLYVYIGVLSLLTIFLCLSTKLFLGLVDEKYIFFDVTFLSLYLLLWGFSFLLLKLSGYSNIVAIVDALWFVPIINILFSLIVLWISWNILSFNFLYIMVGVGTAIIFLVYYIARRQSLLSKIHIDNNKSIFCNADKILYLVEIVTNIAIIFSLIIKILNGIEFAPYILTDILYFIFEICIFLSTLVVCYFNSYNGIKGIFLRAIRVLPYSNLILGLIVPILSTIQDTNSPIYQPNVVLLYALYLIIVIINIVAIAMYHICVRKTRRQAKQVFDGID